MLAVFAEFERDILRDRVKAGSPRLAKRGGRTDDPPPSDATPTNSASFTKKGSAKARSPGA
jgi:DNA invertase Pin-like site-specific DNA recombinase